MEIRNHRIADIWHGQTSNLSSGTISPTVVCNHYTTGWSGKGSRDWLMGAAGGTSNRGSSAHLVIDRDGTAWQIAPFNRRAWHAGPSRYGSLRDLNSHAIGIEFVNPGVLKPDGHGGWVDGYGHRRSSDDLESFGGFIQARHSRVGSGEYAWPLYTPAQLETGREILAALLGQYGIKAIVTHEEIDSRGWKTDPGPAFPGEMFIEMLGEDAAPEDYSVSATRLNIRGGPDTSAERIDPPGSLEFGTRVEVQRRDGVWAFVEVTGMPDGGSPPATLVGWVHSGYLDRVL